MNTLQVSPSKIAQENSNSTVNMTPGVARKLSHTAMRTDEKETDTPVESPAESPAVCSAQLVSP